MKYQVNEFYLNIFSIGPMLCRDEMEDWSASEANLFEEAIEKYGKDFNDIRKDFLPWKSMKNIIEYFFMWKTTDRFVVIHSFFLPIFFHLLYKKADLVCIKSIIEIIFCILDMFNKNVSKL